MKSIFFPIRTSAFPVDPGFLKTKRGHLRRILSIYGMILLPAVLHAEPLAEVAGFSSLPKVDLGKLEKGGIVSEQSPGMNGLPRAQGVESVFVVDASVGKTMDSLKEWNGTLHPDLKVYLHGDLGATSSPGDFKKLGSAPNNEAFRAFVAATEKLAENPAELQLNSAEMQGAPGKTPRGGGMPPEVVTFWSNLLDKRVHAFLSGGVPAQPPYNVANQKISPTEELASLLRAQPKIHAQFHSIIDQSGVSGKPSGKPSLYWEAIDGEKEAAISLGGSFFSDGEKKQSTDLQYYSTGGYYAFLTLYQLWPLDVGSRHETLVWRGDLISSASLGGLKGIERKAAGRALATEIEKLIGHFQKDTAGH